MNKFDGIDFEHAIPSLMAAALLSDNVTAEEYKMLERLLLEAKAKSQPVVCPHCGSTHVGMVDNEPLFLYDNPVYRSGAPESEVAHYGSYDKELYGTFKCFSCTDEFKKVLEISHQ